ncbi:hypothetical protein L3Q82_015368 [Scortum barcoo]|uniref:Uncharacterized protein n=1 Tax=Scortum barcoo TaxID=214431 RepID=A0ACB8VWU2_9TELE|nr:hypothetical protein L3Q82_015368 [Scortum barcoo]
MVKGFSCVIISMWEEFDGAQTFVLFVLAADAEKPPISTFLVGLEANFTGFACVNKRVRYSRTELIKIRDGSATSTTPQTADLGLRALLGRLQLLRTPDWRSAARRTEGKRKRCARKQKRGKRGGLLARLKANAGRPPIPSLFLSNVRSLDNKLDLLRLRLAGFP